MRAVEGGTPIVPLKVKIHSMSIIDRRNFRGPLRGDVELIIGEPMWFDADTDHATASLTGALIGAVVVATILWPPPGTPMAPFGWAP